MNISYCDGCIHQRVCKYTDEVRSYEAKRPVYGTACIAVTYSVECAFKNKSAREEREVA